MVKMGVHVVLPATQDMHERSKPPQTTKLPSDKRERLWSFLACGRLGMKQASEGGRGKTSTDSRLPVPSQPPIITCPGAKGCCENDAKGIIHMID